MRPRRLTLPAAAVALALISPSSWSVPAAAEESWQPFNPFAEVEKRKAEKLKRKQQEQQNRQQQDSPYLPPMDGPPTLEGRSNTAIREPLPPVNAAPLPPEQQGMTSQPLKAPAAAPPVVMREAIPPPVDKGELAPVMSTDGSALPFELWRGLDVAGVEKLISELEIPPRSPALHSLWKRLITSDVTPPSGETSSLKFQSLRLEALYRSGLAKDAAAELARKPAGQDALLAVLAARNELASGNSAKACELIRQSANLKSEMPKRLKGEAVMLSGYCAAADNDAAGAGLAAELAREEGIEGSPGLDALDAISVSARPKMKSIKGMALLDYVLLKKAGAEVDAEVPAKGDPALLVMFAGDAAQPPALRLAAAEGAVKLNALSPEALATIYRAIPPPEKVDARLASEAGGPERRAALFKAAESESTPMKKTRIIRAFLDDAKKAGYLYQALVMMGAVAETVSAQPETSWFAETAVEIALASGKYEMARRWIGLAGASQGGGAGGGLDHWLALADIADPGWAARGDSLTKLESQSVTSRFTPDMLHRLATVLDALAYQVPIPLWEAASRTPQPSTGFLPQTGVLAELQEASKKKEFGRTVLLAMKSLGPSGAEGAHMIALGDSIRALKRAGLETDARRLGLEALLGGWPRTAAN